MDTLDTVRPSRSRASERFTDKQILAMLRIHDQGAPASELCRQHHVSKSTFYRWKAKLGSGAAGMLDLDLSQSHDRNVLGRPSRIAAYDIVRAVQKIGPERASVRNVAMHLGMSPAGLYHHIKSKEELLELVAHFAFVEIAGRPSELDNFAAQLLFYARRFYQFYTRNSWAMQTMISGNYVMFNPKLMPLYETLFASGVREGFDVMEIYNTWMTIKAAVLGAAAIEVAEREAERKKGTFRRKVQKALLTDNTSLPNLRALSKVVTSTKIDHFEKVLITIEGLQSRSRNRTGSNNF